MIVYKTVNVDTDVDVDVEIDVEDFLNGCTDREVKMILKWMKDMDYLNRDTDISRQTSNEILFINKLEKIRKSYLSLSVEDVDTINEISKKY